jgi:hypothetical protein
MCPIGLVAAGVGAAGAIAGGVIASNGAQSAANTAANANATSAQLQKQEFDAGQAAQTDQYNRTLAEQQRQYDNNVALQKQAYTDNLGRQTGVYSDSLARTGQAVTDSTGAAKTALDANTALNSPFLTTGISSLNQLASLYGLDTYDPSTGSVIKGSGTGAGIDPNATFYQTPDYKFALSQGIAGVDAGAAARGGLDSGATRKAEIAYGGNLASGQFNNYASRLQALAGVGQSAAGNQQNANTNYASQVGNAYMGGAQADNAAGANFANSSTLAASNYANNSGNAGQSYANAIQNAGQNYASSVQGAGTNYANNITNLNTNTANTQANADLSGANSLNTTLNTLAGQLQYGLNGKNPFQSSYTQNQAPQTFAPGATGAPTPLGGPYAFDPRQYQGGTGVIY